MPKVTLLPDDEAAGIGGDRKLNRVFLLLSRGDMGGNVAFLSRFQNEGDGQEALDVADGALGCPCARRQSRLHP